MRRRLWWSLVLFDDRINEVQLAEGKTTILAPTWNCRAPLNVNDSDLRAETKILPTAHDNPTEALFAVVRSEMADFVRYTPMHIEITHPMLKPLASQLPTGSDSHLTALTKIIEDKHLRFCDPNIPLHCMTVWMTRAQLAKTHLMELYAKNPQHPAQQTDAHREAATDYAFSALECDTKILSSRGTQGYRWLLQLYFPFPAYIHLVRSLRQWPLSSFAERAWQVMGDNYEARFAAVARSETPPFRLLARTVLDAWEATVEAYAEQQRDAGQQAEPAAPEPPRMVTSVWKKLADMAQAEAQATPSSGIEMTGSDSMGMGMRMNDLSLSMPPVAPVDLRQSGNTTIGTTSMGYGDASMLGAIPPGPELNPTAFESMYWGLGEQRGW